MRGFYDDFGDKPSPGLVGGAPGESWVNRTPQSWFKLVRALRRPCPRCLHLHGRLAPRPWGQLHPGCECESVEVLPGMTAPVPVPDPPEVLARVDAGDLPKLLGSDVAGLLGAGLVNFAEVVDSRWRFRSAEDLVRKKGITREAMVAAGIPEATARRLAGPPS